MNFQWSNLARGLCLSACFIASSGIANADSYLVGGLGNFDAANYEGQDVYGFEVQIEGIQPSDLQPSWSGNKFGTPKVIPYATGVYVRYESPYDAVNHRFTAVTVPKTPGTAFQSTCYMGSPSYYQAGCDHFGVRLNYTAMSKATTTTYHWLVENPAQPGTLVGSANVVSVPTVSYYFQPPPVNQPTAPPVLVAVVELPPPPPPPVPPPVPQYGDATWIKVYKTELNREVELGELVEGNPLVPQNLAQLETDWSLVQPSPPPDGRHRQRGKLINQGPTNAGTRAVVRRYETYAYTGAYDPVTHEAVCADGACNAPLPNEVGEMLVAQMAAANIAVPSITVNLVGGGKVSSSDKVISCGNKCSGTYALGTVVNLTAQANSGFSFGGWTGACAGAATTCAVTVSDALTATATFNPVTNAGGGGGGAGGTTASVVTVKTAGGKGSITSNPAGINCGKVCSTPLAAGSSLTLSATPEPGFLFVNWSGACIGNQPTCQVVGGANLAVQANFSK